MGGKISKMTVEDVKEAVKREEIKKSNSCAMLDGNINRRDSVATKFLEAVNTTCRAFGTSVGAAEYARRKCFALQNILECTVCFSQSLQMTSVAFEYGSMLIQKQR